MFTYKRYIDELRKVQNKNRQNEDVPYKCAMEAQNSLLFGMFLSKVIESDY